MIDKDNVAITYNLHYFLLDKIVCLCIINMIKLLKIEIILKM